MAKLSGRSCRIYDDVRDSKILRDAVMKLDQKLDCYIIDIRQELVEQKHSFEETNLDVHHCGRAFPRNPSGGISKSTYNIHGLDRKEYRMSSMNLLKQKAQQGRTIPGLHAFIHEVDLPIFYGSSQVADFWAWVDAIEDCYDEMNPPEHIYCKLATYKLGGDAYTWWNKLQRERIICGKEEINSWPRMKKLLFNRFLHTRCSTEFLNQLNKKENGEEVKHLMADDFTHNTCLPKFHNQLSQQENGKHDNCLINCPSQTTTVEGHMTFIEEKKEEKNTEDSNKEYSEEMNECNDGAEVVMHAKQEEGAELIKFLQAGSFLPAMCSTEVPFESYINKQEAESDSGILGASMGVNINGSVDILEKATLHQPDIDETIEHFQPEAGENASKHTNELHHLDSNIMASECEEYCLLNASDGLDVKGGQQMELTHQNRLLKKGKIEGHEVDAELETKNTIKALNVDSHISLVPTVPEIMPKLDLQLNGEQPQMQIKLDPHDDRILVHQMLLFNFDPGGVSGKGHTSGCGTKVNNSNGEQPRERIHLELKDIDFIVGIVPELNGETLSLVFGPGGKGKNISIPSVGTSIKWESIWSRQLRDVPLSFDPGGSIHSLEKWNSQNYLPILYCRLFVINTRKKCVFDIIEASSDVVNNDPSGSCGFSKLLSSGLNLAQRPKIHPTAFATILYSSSIIGTCKSVVLAHGNVIAIMVLFVRINDAHCQILPTESVHLDVVSMFHSLHEPFEVPQPIVKSTPVSMDLFLSSRPANHCVSKLVTIIYNTTHIVHHLAAQGVSGFGVAFSLSGIAEGLMVGSEIEFSLWLLEWYNTGCKVANRGMMAVLNVLKNGEIIKDELVSMAEEYDGIYPELSGHCAILVATNTTMLGTRPSTEMHPLYTEDLSISLVFNLTRGRVISWEGWNDVGNTNIEGGFIMAKLSVGTFTSCLCTLCDNGHFRKTLRLFFKMVNGLDPPTNVYGKLCEAYLRFPTSSLEDELLEEEGWTDVGTSKLFTSLLIIV